MARKQLPNVEVSALDLDPKSYPSLGSEDTPEATAGKKSAAPSLPTDFLAVEDSEKRQRQSAWLMASIAGLIAVVALAMAWGNRGLEEAVMALMSATDARVTAQVSALKEENETVFATTQAMVAEEQQQRRQLAAALAVARLDTAARGGGPYLSELELAADLLAADEAAQRHLAILAPAAESGLPPLQHLQSGFSHAVSLPEHRAVMAALLSSLRASVADLLSFASFNGTQKGPHSGRMWDDLRLAQRSLAAGDLQTATIVVKAYGDVLPNAENWVRAAVLRLEAQESLAALMARSEEYLLNAR